MPYISAVLKTYPETFGGQAMEEDLVQAFNDSNMDLISYYIDNFQCLSQNLVSEGMCKYAIANNNIYVIYQIIDKNPKLKNSKDELIKFLANTDLRASNIKPEDINIKLDDGLHSSPLHLAANEGSTELVKVLLSKGANLEAKANNGW